MEKSLLLEAIGDSPKARVLDFLIENSIFDYSKSEIAKNINMSRTTLDAVIEGLIKFEFIIPARHIGRATLYKLNTENPTVKQLIELDNLLIKKYAPTPEKKVALATA